MGIFLRQVFYFVICAICLIDNQLCVHLRYVVAEKALFSGEMMGSGEERVARE